MLLKKLHGTKFADKKFFRVGGEQDKKEDENMPYQVQRGDTIAKVVDLMKTNWKTLRRLNPDAVARSSRNGHWFLREGAVVKGEKEFETIFRNSGNLEGASQTQNAQGKEHWKEYTIKPGDTFWDLAVKRFHVHVDDLMRDNGIEDPTKLRPGQRIRVQLPSYPQKQEVVASWYGKNYHGRPMANGAFFNMYADTIAHRDLPLGTHVELKNPKTGVSVRAVVTDRGPYIEGRDVDLSYGLARKLSLVDQGVGKLAMRVLG